MLNKLIIIKKLELVVGDITMAITAIQSGNSINTVAKLSYQIWGLIRIVKCTGRGSYLVRNLYKPDSPEFKFIAIYLYPLPPSWKACEPVDSSNNHIPQL